MSNYSFKERYVARLLSDYPILKKLAKAIYSRLVYLKNKKNDKFITEYPLSCYELENSFFGYYDKSPKNFSNFTIVCASKHTTTKAPSEEKPISLKIFNSNKVELFDISVQAYNWQQGCRAHWLDDENFIYNDFDYEKLSYMSCIRNTKGEVVNMYDLPVQDTYSDKFFLSINYQRLMALRPDYGYRNLKSMTNDELHEINVDGVWYTDIKTKKSELLFSISDLCDINYNNIFDKAQHKVNHCMISPNGEKFIFMHRYIVGGQRFDRLFQYDFRTKEIQLLSDKGMVSHCCWVSSDVVIGYLRGPNSVDGYWLVDTTDSTFSLLSCKELEVYGDGHPTPFGDWFITDTYPDKARMQHLMMINWKSGEFIKLGEFFHGFEFDGESRCDLHPRFSKDGKSVFFDSVFSGTRKLYEMELPAV